MSSTSSARPVIAIACDEVRVFGGRITPGMERELQYAAKHGIPVRFEGRTLA